MKTRLRVGRRLLVVVAVPLIALGVLTAVFVSGQREQRSLALNDRALVRAFADAGRAQAALRAEQVLSASFMASGDPATADQLAGARSTTDEAFARSTAGLAAVHVKDPDGSVARLSARYRAMVSELPNVRSLVENTGQDDAVDRLEDFATRADIATEMSTSLAVATSPAIDLSAGLVLDQTMAANGSRFAYAVLVSAPGEVDKVAQDRFEVSGERLDALNLTSRTTPADAAERAILNRARHTEAVRHADGLMQALDTKAPADERPTDSAKLGSDAVAAIMAFDTAQTEVLDLALNASAVRVAEATDTIWMVVAIAAAGLVLTALVAWGVKRSLDNPGIVPPKINDLGPAGADAWINLARRNQGLLDRQIRYLDSLESTEQDPDQLERLFHLDHLATRMRRNEASMLLLAGAEPCRQRSRSVLLTDVVRAAIGEVEDYQRLDLGEMAKANVRGSAAADLTHLLSELMENSTRHSSPETTVEVAGRTTPDGGYAVTLTDDGPGMDAELMSEVNERLASPPEVGPSMGSCPSLGFLVVAALAARHRISVRLLPGRAGGVIAAVTLPMHLVEPIAASEGGPGPNASPKNAEAHPVVPGQSLPVRGHGAALRAEVGR